MNKFRTFFLSILFCSSVGFATESCSCSQILVEAKTGYFFFSSSKMRKIYDRGGGDIQVSATYPLWNLTDRWSFSVYGAVEYFYQSGKSTNEHQKTSLWAIPVNIGLKPTFMMTDCMQYYFALGPRYFYLHQQNHSSYVNKNRSKNGVGFFVNTGFNYVLCNHFVMDLFGEYSDARLKFHHGKSGSYTCSTQVGGFTFGGGIGYEF